MSTDPATHDSTEPNQPRSRKPEDFTVVEVRRGVRLQGWIVLGIVLGILLSFVFAYFLPEHEDFTRMQVFGFLAVFLTALVVVIVVAIALIVNFFVGRSSTPQRVLLERVPDEPEVDDAVVDEEIGDYDEAGDVANDGSVSDDDVHDDPQADEPGSGPASR